MKEKEKKKRLKMWEIKCFFGRFDLNIHYFLSHEYLRHGSRLTNFVGIISQGLRIAPPEAPVVSSAIKFLTKRKIS